MSKFTEWLKRILGKVISAFFWSGGNPVVAEIAAVKEVAVIAVEEVTHHETAREGVQAAEQKRPVAASSDATVGPEVSAPRHENPQGERLPDVLPGPTTFDKPVDQVYGKNRKH
jgi:hypothetical protein